MQPSNLLIFGGTDFIDSQLLSRLVTKTFSAPGLPESRMIVPTRDPEPARTYNLTLLPRVDVMGAGICTGDALGALFLALTEHGAKHCAVINLVGMLQDTCEMPYGPDFQHMHVDLPRRIVAVCRRHGVNRLLHMSTLGADPTGPSMCLRSKGDGGCVAMNSELDWTVFRPSVVFGPRDYFLSLLTGMQRMAPFVLLAYADACFQPVYMDDVAAAFINALKKPATIRYAYPLVGPRAYMLVELMRFAGRASGHPRWIIPLPEGLGRMQAVLLEHLPGALISHDNLDSIRVGNVSMESVVSKLGVHSLDMEAVILPALADFEPDRRSRAARMRVHRQSPQKHGVFTSFVNMLHSRGQYVSFYGGAAQDQNGSFAFALPFTTSDTIQLECPISPRDAGGLPQ